MGGVLDGPWFRKGDNVFLGNIKARSFCLSKAQEVSMALERSGGEDELGSWIQPRSMRAERGQDP